MTEERQLIKQESHLIQEEGRCWLTLIVEAHRVSEDPWHTPRPHFTEEKSNNNSARARQRKAKREQRRRDLDAALTRLDERGCALYELLRAWRTSRSAEEGIPPYEFGSDLLLCEIARVRPTTAQSLSQLQHMRPRLLKLFGAELIKLLNDDHTSNVQEANS